MRCFFPVVKRGWRVCSAIAAVVAVFALGATSANAEESLQDATDRQLSVNGEPIDLRLTYDFYLAGLPVAVAKLQARIDDERYNAVTALKTVGVVGFFFDTEMVSSVDGARIEGNALLPALFEMRWRTKEDGQNVRMLFSDDAPESVEASPPFKKKSYEVDPTNQTGALDPMSAIVAAFLPGSVENVCQRTLPVFDARKRFDVRFTKRLREYEKGGQQLIECQGEYVRLAGFKPKMMKQARFGFKIRFAVQPDGSARATRIWGDTHFGIAVALLRDE